MNVEENIRKIESILRRSLPKKDGEYVVDADLIEEILKKSTNLEKLVGEIINKYVVNNEIDDEDYEKIMDMIVFSPLEEFFDVYLNIKNISLTVEKELEKNVLTSSDENKAPVKEHIHEYLKEISAIPLLTPEEEKELFERYRNGDTSVKNRIIESNFRLVVSVAKHFTNRGVELMDLIQEGNIGLITAIDKFDSTKGFKFSTYATHWIKQSIRRAIENTGKSIRVPSGMFQKIKKIQYTSSIYASNHNGEMPTDEQLEEITGYSLKIIKEVKEYMFSEVSIHTPIGEAEHGDQSELIDFIEDDAESNNIEHSAMQGLLKEEVQKVLNEIFRTDTPNDRVNKENAKLKVIIELRFGLTGRKMNLIELGKEFNVSRERIRQLEVKALKKLRLSSSTSKLRDFY